MSDNRLMQEEEAVQQPRLQFRVRHLLLLTAAVAVAFGVLRWIYTLKLPSDHQTPIATLTFVAAVVSVETGLLAA